MSASAVDMVLILGNIGEVREEAEGADDLQCVVRWEAIQRRRKLAAGRGILIAAEADRVVPDLLDGVEHSLPALLAYCVTEDASEQADIATQRQIFVFHFDRFVRHHLSF